MASSLENSQAKYSLLDKINYIFSHIKNFLLKNYNLYILINISLHS